MGKKKPLKTETKKKAGSKSPPRKAVKKTAGSRPARPSKSAPSAVKAAKPTGVKSADGHGARAKGAGLTGLLKGGTGTTKGATSRSGARKTDGASAPLAKGTGAASTASPDAGRSREAARAAKKGAAASPAVKPTSSRRITSSELGRIRTLLTEMKQKTEGLVQREASELRTLEKRHRADLEEMASDTHETDAHCHIMDIENIKIAEIDAALIKLENGTYGVCEDCSQEIPFVRLEALPFATQCIECKSRAERRGQISASASSSDSA